MPFHSAGALLSSITKKEYKFDAKKEYKNTNKQEMEDQDVMPF